VVGVALAIAILGSASAAAGLASFDAWFEVSAVIAVAAAAVSIALGRPTLAVAPEVLVPEGAHP